MQSSTQQQIEAVLVAGFLEGSVASPKPSSKKLPRTSFK